MAVSREMIDLADAVGVGAIDWIAIESQARQIGITNTSSIEFLAFAHDRYMPMLRGLASELTQLLTQKIDTRMPESTTPEDAARALQRVSEKLKKSSPAALTAMEIGRRYVGVDQAPQFNGTDVAEYVNIMAVLGYDGELRHEVSIFGLVRAGVVTVDDALRDAQDTAIALSVPLEMFREGTLAPYARTSAGVRGVGLAPVIVGGVAVPAWAAITVVVAIVVVIGMMVSGVIVATELARRSKAQREFCFKPPDYVDLREPLPPGCESIPRGPQELVDALLRGTESIADKIGWAILVGATLYVGARFVLPEILRATARRRAT